MHMWLHVTNHLITSNDKDSNSETNQKDYMSVTISMGMGRIEKGNLMWGWETWGWGTWGGWGIQERGGGNDYGGGDREGGHVMSRMRR
jgi:hypothetical protein